MISDKVTHVFSYYMDGMMIIPKIHDKNANYSIIFGLPLTTDILVEIISFGLTNVSSEVSRVKMLYNCSILTTFVLADNTICRKNFADHFTRCKSS